MSLSRRSLLSAMAALAGAGSSGASPSRVMSAAMAASAAPLAVDASPPAHPHTDDWWDLARNQRMRSTNTSGVMGVGWHRACGKWRARIKVDGRYRHLGLFDDFAAAVAARKAAEAEFGFHKNHGRLAQ